MCLCYALYSKLIIYIITIYFLVPANNARALHIICNENTVKWLYENSAFFVIKVFKLFTYVRQLLSIEFLHVCQAPCSFQTVHKYFKAGIIYICQNKNYVAKIIRTIIVEPTSFPMHTVFVCSIYIYFLNSLQLFSHTKFIVANWWICRRIIKTNSAKCAIYMKNFTSLHYYVKECLASHIKLNHNVYFINPAL